MTRIYLQRCVALLVLWNSNVVALDSCEGLALLNSVTPDEVAQAYVGVGKSVQLNLKNETHRKEFFTRLGKLDREKGGVILAGYTDKKGHKSFTPVKVVEDDRVVPMENIHDAWDRHGDFPPRSESVDPQDIVAVFPGAIVGVRMSSGKIEPAYIESVKADGTYAVAAFPGPSGILRVSFPVEKLAESTGALRQSKNSNHHRLIAEPTKILDGMRFPSASPNQASILVDRKNDRFLREFLEKNVQQVHRSGSGKERGVEEKVEEAVRIINADIKHTHNFKQHDQRARDWDRNAFRAKRDNRARFLGDSLYYERGVCKDFSLLMAVLLHDAGVETRYVRGEISQGGHAWIEYRDETGKWIALEPQNGRREKVETAYGKNGRFSRYDRSGVTWAEIPQI